MRWWDIAGRSYVGLVLVFLYLPVAVMCVMAFNDSELYALPIAWTGRKVTGRSSGRIS